MREPETIKDFLFCQYKLRYLRGCKLGNVDASTKADVNVNVKADVYIKVEIDITADVNIQVDINAYAYTSYKKQCCHLL